MLSVLLGGAIGLERELRGKPAGLRTNVLICVGATLFTFLSIHSAVGRGDPGRVAAQMLTGVGFIGAGTILHMRGSITGLTSAATIWVVTAIGMAIGTASYVEAIGTTALVMVVLGGLRRVEDAVARQTARSHLLIHVRPEPGAPEELEALIRTTGIEVEGVEAHRENVDLIVEFHLRGARRLHEQALLTVVHHPLVRSISTGE